MNKDISQNKDVSKIIIFIDDYKFDNINKINFKKLSLKLNCSDKTAKKIIEKHAPYLLDLE